MDFDWDPKKNESNEKKHGINFNEAQEVFNDPNLVKVKSKNTTTLEERLIAIGKMFSNLFSVVYTMRDSVTRLISARRANKEERKAYFDNLKNLNTD